MDFNTNRVLALNDLSFGQRSVVYWMSRDQRVKDNWALIYAQQRALEKGVPLYVVFNLLSDNKKVNLRHYDFMLKGLEEISTSLNLLNIPFEIFIGKPQATLPPYLKNRKTGLLVTDFSPLKAGRLWRKAIAESSNFSVVEVDAHNVVPCWVASEKKEFAARTIRPKILSRLDEYLTEFPRLVIHKANKDVRNTFHVANVMNQLSFDSSVAPVGWLLPGEKAALKILDDFIENKLNNYPTLRNNPGIDGLSNLSPYLHFGHISAQRIAFEVKNSKADEKAKEVFLEELIVRKELADNFCYYNPNYDCFEGFPDWAKKTLNAHRTDTREFIYTLEEFEAGKTHDELWNRAQSQMVDTGKMHGYLRMYWAKKILEWSDFPESAMKTAIYLNDKYELDGRDPNGYTGIAWSIGGVHDRPWFDRSIFGMVRYMGSKAIEKKFAE